MAIDIAPVKTMLGIALTDEAQDTLLFLLKKNAQSIIKLELRTTTFPDALDFIADELTIKRYNRISSEGFVNETLASRNTTFEVDALKQYRPFIESWLAMNPDEGDNNKLVML